MLKDLFVFDSFIFHSLISSIIVMDNEMISHFQSTLSYFILHKALNCVFLVCD